MDIELYSGATKVIISTYGGYVTNLADDHGDILFPKRTLAAPDGSEKIRGGCHVCVPNFGPGGAHGYAQHGYGRISEWTVKNCSQTSVELFLAGQGDYVDMESSLIYTVQDEAFTMTLTLKNIGKQPLVVAPAFHPYYFCGTTMPVVNNAVHDTLSSFTEAQFVNGTTQQLRLAGRQLVLQSDDLTRWALWTDQLAEYMCIEPTQSGNAFAEDIKRADRLLPGTTKTYRFTISW